MFRRTHSQDGDITAAAQRRLAALVQHHADSGGEVARPTHEPSASGGDPRTSTDAGATDARSQASPAAASARHLGAQRLQLHGWDVSASHVTVAALAMVTLVVLVAWWSLRSVPQADTVELSSHGISTSVPQTSAAAPSSTSSTPTSPTPAASTEASSPGGRLVVDVAGKVRRPGIVELPGGSRVVDAIAAAGGANPGVSLLSLNLARLLVDGEQIVVGIDVPAIGSAPGALGSGTSTTASQSVAPVDLNTATAEQLDTLPGVGPVTAQAILDFRTENGAFTSVDELLEVSGIGDATLADLRPYVYV